MTRTRRSVYSLIAMCLNTGSSVVIGLVATPLLLDWLGDDRMGLARVGQQWFGYSLLFSMGLDGALAAHFSKAASSGDRSLLLSTIRGGIRAYYGVAFLALLWVGVLEVFAPTLFNTENPALLGELRIGLIFVGVGQCAVLLSAFKTLAEAEQRGYVAQLCLGISAWASVAVSLILAACGGGLAGQFLALSLAPLLSGLMLAVDAVGRYPEILRHPRGEAVAVIRSFPLVMLSYQLCSRLSFISDNIIVDQVLGPQAVVPFTSTQALMSLLTGVIVGIGTATWAALADLHHRGEREAFNRRLIQLTQFVSILACAILVPSAVWDRMFVIAWVREPQRYVGDLFAYAVAASCIAMCVAALWGWPLMTTGRVNLILKSVIAGSAINVIVSIAGTYWLGPIGPVLGTLANLLGVPFWYWPRVLEREFGTSARNLMIASVGPWLFAVPYGFLLAMAANSCPLDDWIPNRLARLAAIAAILGASAAVFLAASLGLLVSVEDRREWLQRLFPRRFPSP